METHKMWIDGKWTNAESGKTFTVVNPATEEEIAKVALGDKADADKAVRAARKALPVWSKKTQAERSSIMSKLADAIEEKQEEIAQIECMDHGYPIEIAREWVQGAAGSIRFAGDTSQAMISDIIPVDEGSLNYMRREPVGVCAIITPWNFPLNMIVEKMGPALAVGNTCVVKPPSINSLAAIKLAEVIGGLDIPPGTVNIITGPGGTLGEALVEHSDVDMVAFTGSCDVGKRIMELASRTVKRVQLELGGKNPFIVLDDADMDAATENAVNSLILNTGQICATPGRYYVHAKIYDEFVDKMVAGLKEVVVGDPTDEKTQMGPVVSDEHRGKVEGYFKIGVDEGAKLILGGQRPTTPPLNKGYFVMPTVFTNVKQKSRLAREEIFGPVACIMEPFNSDEEVLELANDNTFGLCASVWTKDTARGIRMVHEIRAGTGWVNKHMEFGLPWGGYRESGFGKDNSMMGNEEYTQIKSIYVNLT